jgi:hypothetical protein
MEIVIIPIATTIANILLILIAKKVNEKHRNNIVSLLNEIMDTNKELTESQQKTNGSSKSSLDSKEDRNISLNEPIEKTDFNMDKFEKKKNEYELLLKKLKNKKFVAKNKDLIEIIESQLKNINNQLEFYKINAIIT